LKSNLKQIVDEIIIHIENNGGLFSSWFIDISANPRQKLIDVHKVNTKTSLWIIREADNELNARNIKKYIITEFATDGGTKDEPGKYIYAYRKTAATNP